MGWGEPQGPPDCLGERCPHFLAPEDAAHALAGSAELRRARMMLAALPEGLAPVLEAVATIELPDPWAARVRTWWGDRDDGGVGAVYTVGLYRIDRPGIIHELTPARVVRLPQTDDPAPGWAIRGHPGGFATIADAVRYLRDDDRL